MNQYHPTACVYIIDDDEAVRDAISLLLESVGIKNRCYLDAQSFLDTYSTDRESIEMRGPGVIILDVRMPDMNGLECQQQLNQLNCHFPIIFVTGHGDVPMAVEAMKQGAVEFFQKPFRDQDLLDRVQEYLKASEENHQENALSESVHKKLALLTPREKQVLDNIIQGKANKIIAADLNVSQRTVEIHRAKVMDKMAVRSLAELVKMVVEAQLH